MEHEYVNHYADQMDDEYVDHKVKQMDDAEGFLVTEKHVAVTKDGREVLHNIAGPAYKEWNHKRILIVKEYYEHGKLHNPYGAASILCDVDGNINYSNFYLNGLRYSFKDIILIATMLNVVRFEHSDGLTELCYNGIRYGVSDLNINKLETVVDAADIWSRITPHILKHLND